MAIFNHKRSIDVDPFTDLLFNALLTFTFLFFMVLLLLNPPAKSGIIDPKAEFMITATWEDGSPNDVDVWVEGPGGKLVWYKKSQDGLMHLDRDDRGLTNDMQLIDGKEIINPLNQNCKLYINEDLDSLQIFSDISPNKIDLQNHSYICDFIIGESPKDLKNKI